MKQFTILIITTLMVYSCEPEQESSAHLFIKNISSHNVELTVFNAWLPNQNSKDTTFVLARNSEISYYFKVDGELFNFSILPFGGTADSAYLVFNDNLRVIYRRDDLNIRNILDISNWDEVKESDTYFKYTYLITDDDYETAVNIE
jgi:hypothetical protein